MRTTLLIALAFMEALTLFSFVIAILLWIEGLTAVPRGGEGATRTAPGGRGLLPLERPGGLL